MKLCQVCRVRLDDDYALQEHIGDVHGFSRRSELSFARQLSAARGKPSMIDVSYDTTVSRTSHGDIEFTISGGGKYVLDPAEAARIAEETLRLIRGQQ